MSVLTRLRDLWSGDLKASHGIATGMGRGTSYRASSGLTQDLAAYWPPMTSGDSASLPSLRTSLDRARDLVRNDPHAGAGIERLVDMLIGSGWQLVATPDARALGLDPSVTREIGRQIRSEWRLFSRDPRKLCDARRRLSMDGLFRLGARTFATANEATAVLKFRNDPSARYATCVALIDPDRLCNPNNVPNSLKIRGGVEFDDWGAPTFYHIRNAHLSDYWASPEAMSWTRVPRETEWGRPVFIHAFEGDREDQTRAVTPFASLVSPLRMLGLFADTELQSATINALIAATIESDLPTDEVAGRLAAGGQGNSLYASWMDKTISFFENSPVTLIGARIPLLPPGSKISMNASPRQTTSYSVFEAAFLRKIASRLGISYEQLSTDFTQTNYSSARAALNETYRTIKRLQSIFAEQFVQPIYIAFLEEAFDKGHIQIPKGAPAFWDLPSAWVQARWIGPGRGYIDPTKEAEAAGLRMDMLISTLEDECAEQGRDHIDVLDELALEQEELAARNLQRASAMGAVSTLARTQNRPGADQQNADEQSADDQATEEGEEAAIERDGALRTRGLTS